MSLLQHLGGDQSEIAGVGAGLGAAFAPIDEAEGVLGVPGHGEGVDKGGGEDGLLEAVAAALAVEGRQDEAEGGEVVAGVAEDVQVFPEHGPLLRRRLAPLHPGEQAAEHAHLRLSVVSCHFSFSFSFLCSLLCFRQMF